VESHDLCDLFPPMSKEELHELSGDMAKHGQLEPIWVHRGKIIDGRHRFQVCCILGLTPAYQEWAGECGSILRFVVAKNLHRRHLGAGQKATLAVEILPRIEEEIREELRRKQREGGRTGGSMAGRGRPKKDDRVSCNYCRRPYSLRAGSRPAGSPGETEGKGVRQYYRRPFSSRSKGRLGLEKGFRQYDRNPFPRRAGQAQRRR
jgi:hypothetical protein